MQAVDLSGDLGRVRHRQGAEITRAGEGRRPIRVVRIVNIRIGERALALVPPFGALVGQRIGKGRGSWKTMRDPDSGTAT